MRKRKVSSGKKRRQYRIVIYNGRTFLVLATGEIAAVEKLEEALGMEEVGLKYGLISITHAL